ncbi:MAG: hypothetical protein JWQ42_4338 [Edaphobacter sp.]|nr:hypothetical protein [Edaphobacter sp.]
MKVWLLAASVLLGMGSMSAQDPNASVNGAGYVPLISGGAGYVHNVNGGQPTLEPQINPVLLVPFGSHVLLESRTDFTGFFQRKNGSSGPFTGKVFKTVEYAQIDWLANTHVIATAGRYLLPFGLYNERLTPIWIRNLQDSPITAPIGTRTSGSGDGVMLRGAALDTPSVSILYTAYFSARSGINQLQAARAAGGDTSIYLKQARLEVGGSYQRFLQDNQINSFAAYLSWQPPRTALDLKFEYDQSHNGHGFWLESGYELTETPKIPALLKRVQLVGRVQQFTPLNGGGNGVPRVATQRMDAGLNYYIRDDLRFVSSYGRQFSSTGNANIWNVGFTYRFMFPLWPGRRQ